MKKNKQYNDVSATLQVIGNIYNNNTLLDNDKYFFKEADFVEEFHRIIFGSIYNLHALGANKIDIQAIEDYLEARPKSLGVYKANNGREWLENITDKVSISTFDYYYQKVKKMTLLREYSKFMDLKWLYDPDEIFDVKKIQAQEDWLDNTSLEEIADTINNKIERIKSTYVNNGDASAPMAIGNGIFETLQSFKESPEFGYPMVEGIYNTIFRGARLKKVYMRSAATGVGKAIPNDTLIPTPVGWRKVGDIKVGDYLFGQDGKPTKVLKTYPQPEQKDIWEVEFSDGRIAKCCGEHLWEYRYETHRGKAYRVEDTQTIYERTLKLKNGFRDSCNKGFRFHIKLNEALEYPEREYSVHPYVMGALLGDGSFRYDNTNKALTFSSKNDKIPAKIASLLKGDYIYKKNSKFNYDYTFKPINNTKHNLWVEEILTDYPELWQTKSETKFIPKDYLMGSIEQRYELLKGLLDTDGSIDEKGTVRFTTISPQLRDDVIELSRSLGMVANYLIDKRESKYTTGECYSIIIQSKKETKPLMFSLDYKLDIAVKYANSNKRNEHKDHLAIVDIRKTSIKADMTCFTVDNSDHLFLMNDFIVTHNTRSMVGDACFFACDELFDIKTNRWKRNYTQEPTLFIATEQERKEIISLCLAFVSGVNEEHILTNKYLEGEEMRVQRAAEILKNAPLYIKELPDFTLADIENCIVNAIKDFEVKYICMDYIHTSISILSEISTKAKVKGLREDNILFMIGVKLKDIANQYGIFIQTATQLNGQYTEAKEFDQNLLRGAKSLGDKIDAGMIMLRATQEDLIALEPVLATGKFDTPDTKISIYKNRAGRINHVLIWCKSDKGICRFNPLFVTDYTYELQDIPSTEIEVSQDYAW